MFSTISKLADKAFILGFFIPVLLFALACLWLFADIKPFEGMVGALTKKDTLEQLTYLLLTVWSLAVILQLFNLVLFQIFEGYRWPLSSIGRLATAERGRFDELNLKFDKLNDELKLSEVSEKQFPEDKEAELYDLRFQLVREFPDDPEYLLPTRFGNVIRAFEVYSRYMYGADAIPLWLRLAAVVPKDFQQAVEDTRAQVNFVINICFLLCIFALLAFFHSTISLFEYLSSEKIGPWVAAGYALIGIASVVLARIMYKWSIERALAWGEMVKAAFDCYLPALAKQLGYQLPKTGKERIAFWEDISRAAIYNRRLTPEKWPTAEDTETGEGAKEVQAEVPGAEETAVDSEKEPKDPSASEPSCQWSASRSGSLADIMTRLTQPRPDDE